MDDFAMIVGAIASVAAVHAAVQQFMSRRRVRWIKDELADYVFRLERLRRQLIAWIASVTDASERAGSAGYLNMYAGITGELEQHIAAVRAIDAEGAVGRLRADVEEALRTLLREWDWTATLIPVADLLEQLDPPYGLHAVERSRGIDVTAEERHLVGLLRTIKHQLGDPDAAYDINEELPVGPSTRWRFDMSPIEAGIPD